MDLRQFGRYAPALYDAGVCVYLEGPPGCGKSEYLAGLPARLGPGVGYHRFDASSVDPAEVPGFVAPVKDSDGEGIAAYLRSALMPTKEYLAAHPQGILHIDELPTTAPAVRHALDPVLLERRFGPRVLPAGWRVWASGNRTSDYSGAQRIESKTMNRMVSIPLAVNLEQWQEDYATPNNLDPVGVAFLRSHPAALCESPPRENAPFCTLRSYTAVLRIWARLPKSLRTSQALPVLAGSIGQGAAAEFLAYQEAAAELPSVDALVASPETAPVPKRLDLAYAAQMCATRAAIDGSPMDACWRYIARLPAELQLMAAKQLSTAVAARMGESQALAEYLARNAEDIIDVVIQ